MRRTRVEPELQNEKSTVGFEPTRTGVSRVDKSSPGFTCAIFRNLPVARGRCSKIICRLFLSYNICIALQFVILRSLLNGKRLQNVIHQKN